MSSDPIITIVILAVIVLIFYLKTKNQSITDFIKEIRGK
jgi:hypothetical protein